MDIRIRTADALARFVSSLPACRALALDTESDSLYHHFEKVCLIQLATDRGDAVLVDPLAFEDLSALGRALADPGLVKVLHGADYDVTTLKRDFGFEFASLFDTMIAARILGLPQIGLQAVARAELGVELSKASQKDDWSVRPLSPEQEAYALADVRHLLELHERLSAKLRAAGRLEWVLEDCEAVARLPAAKRRNDPDAYQDIKGAKRLPRRGLAVVRELHAWREGLAASGDRPAFKVLGDESLLTLAEARPRTLDDLARVRGILPRLREEANSILDAIRRALALPDSGLPQVRVSLRPAVPEPTRKRIEALRAWRAKEAAQLGVDISVVLPQRLLEKVAEAAPKEVRQLGSIEGLRRWRVQAFGHALVDAVRTP